MNTPMKIVTGLVLIFLVGVSFHFMSWDELNTEIATQKAEYKKLETKKERLENDIAKLEEYEKEAEALEKELSSLVQSKFTKEEPALFVANYIAEIERMVVGQQEATGDFDFKILSVTPKGETTTKVEEGEEGEEEEAAVDEDGLETEEFQESQGFKTRVFDMNLTGQYTTLVEFLYDLGELKLDRLVTINKITLSPQESEDGTPILSVKMPITAYLRQGSDN